MWMSDDIIYCCLILREERAGVGMKIHVGIRRLICPLGDKIGQFGHGPGQKFYFLEGPDPIGLGPLYLYS